MYYVHWKCLAVISPYGCRNIQLEPDSMVLSNGHKLLMSAIKDGLHSTSGIAGPIISNNRIISTGVQHPLATSNIIFRQELEILACCG